MFLVFQLVTRIPLLTFLPRFDWYKSFMENVFAAGIFLGLIAGIFETAGRFIGLRFLLGRRQEWKNGIAYGIGHGGLEAVVLRCHCRCPGTSRDGSNGKRRPSGCTHCHNEHEGCKHMDYRGLCCRICCGSSKNPAIFDI